MKDTKGKKEVKEDEPIINDNGYIYTIAPNIK